MGYRKRMAPGARGAIFGAGRFAREFNSVVNADGPSAPAPTELEWMIPAPAKEFGPRKIRVNALSPGGSETEGAHAVGVPKPPLANVCFATSPSREERQLWAEARCLR